MRTSLKAVVVGVLGVWPLAAGTAVAQEAPPEGANIGINFAGKTPGGVGGFRVGEGAFLRAGVSAEAGYDTNVFYNDAAREEAAILLVTPSLELTNAGRDDSRPPLFYQLGAQLVYREYLTEDVNIKRQRAFNPTLTGTLGYNSGGVSASLSDSFTRFEEAPYRNDAKPIVRDHNQAQVQLGFAPGGGRIQTTLRYVNGLDIFEADELEYASRMSHNAMLDTSWKWLPKTAVFIQVNGGYNDYYKNAAATSQAKYDSVTYGAGAGLRGLVTPKLTMALAVGYSDAIYDDESVNPSGLSNLLATLSLAYLPTSRTRLGLAYGHEFRDSNLLGNYYDLDAVTGSLTQQLSDFVLTAFSRWEYRRYHGPSLLGGATRNDHVFQTGVQLDYYLQRWFYAGVGYSNQINRASTSGGGPTSAASLALDYTKHIFLGRLGIKY